MNRNNYTTSSILERLYAQLRNEQNPVTRSVIEEIIEDKLKERGKNGS